MALGYVLVYLANESLPWGSFIDTADQPIDISSLLNIKRLCDAKVLCKGLPSVFHDFLAFVLNLAHCDVPQMAEYDIHSRAFQDFARGAMRTG